MRVLFRSVRGKMLLPALAVALATVAAVVTVLALSAAPMRQLRQAEESDARALQLSNDMLASLDRLHLLHRLVAATGSESDLSDGKDLYATLSERLQSEGHVALAPEELAKVRALLQEYGRLAGEEAARLSRSRPASGSTSLLSLYTEDRFSALRRVFEGTQLNAQFSMSAALEAVRESQRRSLWTAAAILLLAALSSVALAVLVASRTAAPLRLLSEATQRIAEGDLSQALEVTAGDEVGELAAHFRTMVARLRELVTALQSASDEMAAAAGQLTEHTRAQAGMLEAQASGVAETSATTRELEQTSNLAASQAASVLQVAQRAVTMSEAGRGAAERSVGELHSIQGSVDGIVNQSSELLAQVRQVGDIVATVRDLAAQSHVLSLNASIEAARAGEAGKGFGVVAQEVRDLAAQSGQGAARIGRMVTSILAAVQRTRDMTAAGTAGVAGSLEQIRASGESLRSIGDTVRETSDAALHIASAVQQQSLGIAQIAAAMHDLDRGMEQTVARLRGLEESAERIALTATRISGVAAEFKL